MNIYINILITSYLLGVIGACIISYFDDINDHGPVNLFEGAVVAMGGLIVFAFGLWVLKEEMRYSRENAAFDGG